jgi:hypothetical protein
VTPLALVEKDARVGGHFFLGGGSTLWTGDDGVQCHFHGVSDHFQRPNSADGKLRSGLTVSCDELSAHSDRVICQDLFICLPWSPLKEYFPTIDIVQFCQDVQHGRIVEVGIQLDAIHTFLTT